MLSDKHVRIFEVTTKDLEGLPDSRGESVRSMLNTDHGIKVESVRVIMGYQVRSTITDSQAQSLTYDLFADPVIEVAATGSRILDDFSDAPEVAIQIGFKPGVTDNTAQAGLDGLITLFPEQKEAGVATYRTYAFWGVQESVSPSELAAILHNPMIERASVADRKECSMGHWPELGFPDVPANIFKEPRTIELEVSDDALLEISDRGLLALNLEEMKAIQDHYRDPTVRAERTEHGLQSDRPTDAELECLAQTWSEHCSHKIFAAKIRHLDKTTDEDSTINSLFKTT
jgi:phosphoribosylformylglycinamidine (FGAM) synthase PurS component